MTIQDNYILVTGATAGIGEATARALAIQGNYVILLARNADKAEQVRRRIVAAAGHDRVGVLLADLSSLEEVRRAADHFQATYPRLDVLINNAGIYPPDHRRTSADGYELTVATNHLGPFLLTSLLFGSLQASPAARIVNVASGAYLLAKPAFADFQSAKQYSPFRIYADTKLYNIMFTQELARRMRAHGIHNVVTNCLHPGFVASDFGEGTGGWMKLALLLGKPFQISPEKGAQTSIFLATDPRMGSISGGLFDKKEAVPVKHAFNTPAHAQQLWELSEELTGTRFLD